MLPGSQSDNFIRTSNHILIEVCHLTHGFPRPCPFPLRRINATRRSGSRGLLSDVFRVPFLIAIALAIAFGGGLFSTLQALNASAGFGAIRVGAWVAFPGAHTADADPYAKSHRAKAGRLLYGTAEGLAFTASTDSQNRPLLGTCSYAVRGRTPTARLWTLYASDLADQPLLSADKPSAFNSRTVLRAQDGAFSIEVSARARPGNWMALPGVDPFKLVLTLLDTPVASSSGLVGLQMPEIERIGCGTD